MNLEELFSTLRALRSPNGGAADALDVASTLLRYCRAHLAALDQALRDESQRRALGVVERAVVRFIDREHRRDEIFRDTDLQRLVDALGIVAADIVPVVIARAAAVAFDHRYGPMFFRILRSRGEVLRLKAGDPYVVADPGVLFRHVLAGAVTPDPDRLDALDGTSRLRLCPETIIGVTFDMSRDDVLTYVDPFHPGAAIALAIPGGRSRYTWSEPDPLSFYDVRPVDEVSHWGRIKALLDEAERRGAVMVVFPELCTTPALVEQARTWFGAARRSLRCLVVGSWHVPQRDGKGPGANRAEVMWCVGPPATHDKFEPFELGARREYIDALPHITVHACARWSFAMVICKDILRKDVARLLADLRVRLLVVPAFSPKSSSFELRAGGVALDAQGVVAIANTPHDATDVLCVLARPALADAISAVVAGTDDPCALILGQLDGRENVERIDITI